MGENTQKIEMKKVVTKYSRSLSFLHERAQRAKKLAEAWDLKEVETALEAANAQLESAYAALTAAQSKGWSPPKAAVKPKTEMAPGAKVTLRSRFEKSWEGLIKPGDELTVHSVHGRRVCVVTPADHELHIPRQQLRYVVAPGDELAAEAAEDDDDVAEDGVDSALE